MANWDSLRLEHISDSAQFSGCLSGLLQDLPITPSGPGAGGPVGVPSTPPACCCSPTRQPALTSCPTRALAAQRWRLAGRAAEQAGPASSPSCTWLALTLTSPCSFAQREAGPSTGLRGPHSGTCEGAWHRGFFFSQNNTNLVCTCSPSGAGAGGHLPGLLPRQSLWSRPQLPPALRLEGFPWHLLQGHPSSLSPVSTRV